MNVSAHVRSLDYRAKLAYSKSKRRVTDDETAVVVDADEERRKRQAREEPDLGLDEDDDTLEYARAVPSQVGPAKHELIAETVRPTTPPVATTALWSLLSTVSSEVPSKNSIEPKKSQTPTGDSLFALLDQVVSQA